MSQFVILCTCPTDNFMDFAVDDGGRNTYITTDYQTALRRAAYLKQLHPEYRYHVKELVACSPSTTEKSNQS